MCVYTMYIYIYIHIHICIYIHMYIHICIYTVPLFVADILAETYLESCRNLCGLLGSVASSSHMVPSINVDYLVGFCATVVNNG